MAEELTQEKQNEAVVNQFREFLMSYNKLSEMCFTDCIHDFTTRKTPESETLCVINCMEKYLKMTQRISQRFQEIQLQQNEGAIAAAQTQGLLKR